MDLGLSARVALVAGGASGCGFAIARELAREGARVVLTSRHQDKVDRAVGELTGEGLPVAGIAADMGIAGDCARMADEARRLFGDPDILVMNPPGPRSIARGFEATPDAEFRDAYEQWVMSLVMLTRQVLPAMKARRWGRIVDIGSVGMKTPHLHDLMYLQNTRVAVNGVMKTLAHEYGAYGITANTIATGPFLTEVSRAYMEQGDAQSGEAMIGMTALGRWGQPEEMGAVVAFLCSERASYVTGITMRVDGGYTHSLF
ncbi:MAG: SDR family oxidoreductase [Gammaproteobacteria bacterium]